MIGKKIVLKADYRNMNGVNAGDEVIIVDSYISNIEFKRFDNPNVAQSHGMNHWDNENKMGEIAVTFYLVKRNSDGLVFSIRPMDIQKILE